MNLLFLKLRVLIITIVIGMRGAAIVRRCDSSEITTTRCVLFN